MTILHMLVWGIAAACIAMVEPRFWFAVGGFFLAFILAARWPERRWDFMSASTFVLLVVVLRSWWRPLEDRPQVWSACAPSVSRGRPRGARPPPP